MKLNKQKLVVTAFIATALLILTQSSQASNSQTHSLDTKGSDGRYFQLDNGYGLWFDAEQIYLGDANGLWTWLDSNGIQFYNLRVDGDACSTWSIRVENANVTVNSLFKDSKLAFTLSAPSWTVSTTHVYCGDYGKPASISGTSSWSYNYASNIATINVLHFSPQEVELEWFLPPALVVTIRSNFYLAFALISLVPIVVASMILVALVKGREDLDMTAIFGLTGFFIALIIGFIILLNVMNALI